MACTKNPILEYLTNAIADSQSIYNYVTDNQFINMGSAELFCCPDCELYFLGPLINKTDSNRSPLRLIFDLLSPSLNFPINCCENYDANDLSVPNLIKNSNIYFYHNCIFYNSIFCWKTGLV